MKYTLRTLIGIALLASYPTLQAQDFALPQSPTAPVITLDYQGDRLKRIDDAPTLTILANGDIVMPKNYAHSKAYNSRISQSELQQLMDFIINENQFFDYDAHQVEAKLNQQKRQPPPVHSSMTIISVTVEDRSKEVRILELGSEPMVEETARMLAVHQRLDQLMSVVKLESVGRLDSLLATANAELDSKIVNDSKFSTNNLQSSNAVPFTEADLEGGAQRADGSVYARFKRSDGATVTIDILADGQRLVTVTKDE